MSFWMTIKTVVEDLEIFKNTCNRSNIKYEESIGTFLGYEIKAKLFNMNQRQPFAYLVKDGGAFRVMFDTDNKDRANSIMRDYTVNNIEKQIGNVGGMIFERVENPDGSIILKCAVNS